jgi:tetratricopeptide (TPR) repeat protein
MVSLLRRVVVDFCMRGESYLGALGRRAEIYICVLLIGAVVAVYWPVRGYEFLNYDDDVYVTDNYRVLSGFSWDGLGWAFSAFHGANWHPLTWLSLMFDAQLFGLNAGGYHWTNVLIHALSTVVLFLVFYRMTGALWRSGIVAVLFGLHPLHVESVAWIAERKDVLSGFFWMVTLWMYAVYAERLGWWRYLLVVLFFVLGLLSKPMVVTLPFVMLLLDYWPLGRHERSSWWVLIREKLPLIVLSAASSVITVFAQGKGQAISSLDALPFMRRLANALVSYVVYLRRLFVPVDLAVFYPYPQEFPLYEVLGAFLFLGVITYLAWRFRKEAPYAVTGWLWYLGTLVPVIGLVQVGSQALADRYTYLPLIGIFLLLAWGVNSGIKVLRIPNILMYPAGALPLFVMIIFTSNYLPCWENGITLSRRTLQTIGDNSGTYNNLGNALARKGYLDEAVLQYQAALRLKPDYPDAMMNLGNVLLQKAKYSEAIEKYEDVLNIVPGYIKARFNLAIACAAAGDEESAERHYLEIIRNDPSIAPAYNNLGIIYARKDRFEEAARLFRMALMLNDRYEEARNNLNVVLRQMNRKNNWNN